MKKIVQLVVFLSMLSFNLLSQNESNVRLKINHLLNGEKMELSKIIQLPNSYYIKVDLLRYYVSEIKIIHDGGLLEEVKDTWLLVNPATNYEYDLGNHNITNIEGIQFGLGVDNEHNHLDPTVYPANHPLALQDPSMHWGWSSGYRFITFEGFGGTTPTKTINEFQLHTLDDMNYKTVKINLKGSSDAKGKIISLDAEYTKLLNAINVSAGLIVHSATGEAATQMKNLSTVVFTPSVISASSELDLKSIEISPNPANNYVQITSPISNGNQEVIISDITGKKLLMVEKNAPTINIPLQLSDGNFFISIYENNKLIASKKLIIKK